jgi:CheY-like chemotaxis protein
MAKDILALVDDLFFTTKIGATAKNCGIPVEIVKTKEALIERVRVGPADLIIVDLNGRTTNPVEAIQALKSDPELRSRPILAFLSHVQVELKERALAAGCDVVIPRSLFSQRLAEILTEHSWTSGQSKL